MNPKLNMRIGMNIRAARERLGMSREDLCELLTYSKIKGKQLFNYETGESRWPVEILVDICEVLNLDLRVVVGEIEVDDIGDMVWEKNLGETIRALSPARADLVLSIVEEFSKGE